MINENKHTCCINYEEFKLNIIYVAMKRYYSILCLLFLTLGMIIYTFVNQETFLFALFPASWNIPNFRTTIPFIDSWLLCYGADFFWSASFTLAVQFVMELKGKQLWLLWFCSILGIIVEGLQAIRVMNGTFDLFDIVAYCAGNVLAVIIIMRRIMYENKQ